MSLGSIDRNTLNFCIANGLGMQDTSETGYLQRRLVKAMEDFNRARKVEALLAAAGTFPNFPSNDEIEAADLEYEERMARRWEGKK